MTASPASITSEEAIPPARPECAGGGGGNVFERRLIADAQGGCHDSYRLLVEQNQDMVFRICRQCLGCPDDAREVCQDTFVRAYDALPKFRPRSRFSTWLFRIALNLCRDRIRARAAKKRSAEEAVVVGEDSAICPLPCPDESLALSEELERLRLGLDLLPARHREALVLSAFEGMDHAGCAEVLGCTVRAVEGRLHRARKALLLWWDSQG